MTPSLDLIFTIGRTVVLTGALVGFAWMFYKWRKDVARDTQRVFEQLDLLRAELMVVQDRLEGLQVPQPVTAEPRPAAAEPRLPNVVATAAPRGYEVAARLARSGASVDELMTSCGLSRHEAALLLRLHGNEHKQAPAAAAAKTATANKVAESNAKTVAPLQRKSRLSVVG